MKTDLEKIHYNFTTYSLIFLLVISVVIGLNSHDLNDYIIWFILLCLLLYIMFRIYKYLKKNKEKEKIIYKKKELERFKLSSDKIMVNLQKIKVKSNSWRNRRIISETEYYSDAVEEDVNLFFFEIKIEYQGKIIKYEFQKDMEPKSLEIHFAIQKQTVFYIDPNDADKYYLDLEFLN